jgi:hypothetical protein
MTIFGAISKRLQLSCEVLGLAVTSNNCRYPDTLPKGVRTALIQTFPDNKAYRGVPETVSVQGEAAVDAYRARIKRVKAERAERVKQLHEERRRQHDPKAQQHQP